MSSVVRFDLLNFLIREPIEVIPSECPTFSRIEKLMLFPRGARFIEPSGSWRFDTETESMAFVEIKDYKDDLSIQKISEEFMDLTCWLLSLAELHDVYYWGSHHYVKESSGWKLRSSFWKLSRVRDWKPQELKLGSWMQRAYTINVPYWRLPHFLSQGLRIVSDSSFARNDYVIALQIFLDSLPTDQFFEFRFIKKWIAFEMLVNSLSEADGSLYVFEKEKSSQFKELREQLDEVIGRFLPGAFDSKKRDALYRQLSALERVPIKMLARDFLNEKKIKYNETELDMVVELRDRILHYGKPENPPRDIWGLDRILGSYINALLCELIECHPEIELKEEYVSPYNEPVPDYVKLQERKLDFGLQGIGKIEDEDGRVSLECRGRVLWNRERIEGLFTYDHAEMPKIFDLHKEWKSVRILLTTEDGSNLLIDRAKISGVQLEASPSFNIVGLSILREIPKRDSQEK